MFSKICAFCLPSPSHTPPNPLKCPDRNRYVCPKTAIKKHQLPMEKIILKKGFRAAACSEPSQGVELVTESHHGAHAHTPAQISTFCSLTCPKDISPPVLPKLWLPSPLHPVLSCQSHSLPGGDPHHGQMASVTSIPGGTADLSAPATAQCGDGLKRAAQPAPGAQPTLLNADGGLGLPVHL